LITFIGKSKQSNSYGYLLAFSIFTLGLYDNFAANHHSRIISLTGNRIRSSLTNAIFKKSLKLTSKSRLKANIGEIINLIQVNTQVFIDLASTIHMIVLAPIQVILGIVLLSYYFGIAAVIAFAVMLAFLPLGIYFSFLQNKYETRKIEIKDKRIKLINDVLNGM
jgi:ATP-binding cassette, subfamily C (CFTR/MRP), member 1